MRTKYLLMSLLIAGMASIFLTGCQDGGASKQIYVKHVTGQRIRVAVLPFDNASQDQDAGRILTNTVVTYLLSTGDYDVVEPGIVYAAITSENVRLNEGITQDICKKLQPKLNADAFIVGMVEDYGEIRIGPDSYPSISFSARLVDARSAEILWAATISKTGAENVKVFDIGRISSLGKLSKLAVKAMADSLANNTAAISTGMKLQPAPEAPRTVETTPVTPATNVPATASTEPATGQSAKYLDESVTYEEKGLSALLKDTDNAKIGEMTYKKHFHNWIETSYKLNSGGKTVEVRLVDYLKVAPAARFVQLDHPDDQGKKFESLQAFSFESDFEYYHLDVAVGRFGLYIEGPKALKSEIDTLAKGIIAQLK
ncbi:MAG: GNA1162 family protein [Armatimonadota bacterium]